MREGRERAGARDKEDLDIDPCTEQGLHNQPRPTRDCNIKRRLMDLLCLSAERKGFQTLLRALTSSRSSSTKRATIPGWKP
jgi:hypothetical protein